MGGKDCACHKKTPVTEKNETALKQKEKKVILTKLDDLLFSEYQEITETLWVYHLHNYISNIVKNNTDLGVYTNKNYSSKPFISLKANLTEAEIDNMPLKIDFSQYNALGISKVVLSVNYPEGEKVLSERLCEIIAALLNAKLQTSLKKTCDSYLDGDTTNTYSILTTTLSELLGSSIGNIIDSLISSFDPIFPGTYGYTKTIKQIDLCDTPMSNMFSR